MTDKEQANNLSRYLYECASGEEMFNQQYQDDISILNDHIDDVCDRLQLVIDELYNKHDTFSECMSRSEFEEMILLKIKEQL